MNRKEVSDDFAQAYFQSVYATEEKLPMNTNTFPPIVDEKSIIVNRMSVLKFMSVMWNGIQDLYGNDMREFGLIISTVVTHYDVNYPYFDMFTNETLGVHTIQDYADFLFNIMNILFPQKPSSSTTPIQFVQDFTEVSPPVAWNPGNPVYAPIEHSDVLKGHENITLINEHIEFVDADLEEGILDEMFFNNPEDLNQVEAKLSNIGTGIKKLFNEHLRHHYPASVFVKKKKGKGSKVAIVVTKNNTINVIDFEAIDIDGIPEADISIIDDNMKTLNMYKKLAENVMSEKESLVVSNDTIGTLASIESAVSEFEDLINDVLSSEEIIQDTLKRFETPENIPIEFKLLLALAKDKGVEEKIRKVISEVAKFMETNNEPGSSMEVDERVIKLAGKITKIGGFFNTNNLWVKSIKDTMDSPKIPPFVGLFVLKWRNATIYKPMEFVKGYVDELFAFPETYEFLGTLFRPNFMYPKYSRNIDGFSQNNVVTTLNTIFSSEYVNNISLKNLGKLLGAKEDAEESHKFHNQAYLMFFMKFAIIIGLYGLSTNGVKSRSGLFKTPKKATGYAIMIALLALYFEHSLLPFLISSGILYTNHKKNKRRTDEVQKELEEQMENDQKLLEDKEKELSKQINFIKRKKSYLDQHRDKKRLFTNAIKNNRTSKTLDNHRQSIVDTSRELKIWVENKKTIELINEIRELGGDPGNDVIIGEILEAIDETRVKEFINNELELYEGSFTLRDRAANLLSILES